MFTLRGMGKTLILDSVKTDTDNHIIVDLPNAVIKKKTRIQIHFSVVFKNWVQLG